MEETSNVPKLRFKEFTKPWEAQKLGEILTLIQSGLSRKLSQKDIGVPVLRSNNLINNELNLDDISYWYIKDSKGAKIENYFLKENDLLINFINSLSQIGKIALFKNELKRNTIFTTNLLRLNFNSKIYIDFMYFYFQTGKYNNYIQVITKPAVNQASFTTVDLKKFNLKVPSLHEQKKIANFLNSINHKIKLLNKKLGYFKDFKKYCFQNLFSEKLRFNFKSDWSTSLIKDVFNERNEKGFTDLDLLSVSINEGVYVNENELSSNEKIRYKHVCSGDIVYNSMRMWQGASGVSPQEGLVSPAYTVLIPKNSVNPDYFAYYFKTSKMINEFRKYSQGLTSDTWNLKYPLISKISIKYPSLQEQIQIASFLSTIDDKINYVKNQITEMEKFKKGLLQEMFVYLIFYTSIFLILIFFKIILNNKCIILYFIGSFY